MRAFIFFVICVALALQLYFLSQRLRVPVEAPEDPLSAALSPGATAPTAPANPVRGIEIIRGSVTGESGEPVPNAEVKVIETNFADFEATNLPRTRLTWITKTGPDGMFALDTLGPGDYVVKVTSAQGHCAATATLTARGAAAELSLVATLGRRVEGRVLDEKQSPIEGARIFVLSAQQDMDPLVPYRYLPETTDEEGSFAFESLPAGPSTFLAVAKGFAPASLSVVGGNTTSQPLEFTLGPGIRFAGYLIEDDSGRQADRASIVLTESSFSVERYRKSTTPSAAFLFADLRPATYKVSLESSKYALATYPLEIDVRNGLGNTDIHVVRAGRIKGRVLREDGRDGIEGITVSARNAASGFETSIASGGTGQYNFDGLPPGPYTVAVESAHGSFTADPSGEVAVEAGRMANGPTFRHTAGASVSGRVVDAAGKPAPGANVYLSTSAGRTQDHSARTGVDGSFELTGVAIGALVRVWAEGSGFSSVSLGPETIPASGLSGLTFGLSLANGGGISGRVLDASGSPASRALVYLKTPDATLVEPLSAEAGPDGAFSFTALIEGPYTVSALRRGQSPGNAVSTERLLGPNARIDDVELVLP